MRDLIPRVRIALVESGDDRPFAVENDAGDPEGSSSDFRDPTKFPLLRNGIADRGYRTVPQGALNDRRRLSIARAAGLGGCLRMLAPERHDMEEGGFARIGTSACRTGWKGDDVDGRVRMAGGKNRTVRIREQLCGRARF
mmetsp:Transcript_7937/g.17167  ORF Transcript_7937/g.17167 Transcript_7937/m.17167 type:complete len:140 (+) Transcript_7937:144-563(+)